MYAYMIHIIGMICMWYNVVHMYTDMWPHICMYVCHGNAYTYYMQLITTTVMYHNI